MACGGFKICQQASFEYYVRKNTSYHYDELKLILDNIDDRYIGELIRRIKKEDVSLGREISAIYSTIRTVSKRVKAFWYSKDSGTNYNPDWADVWQEEVEEMEDIMDDIEVFIDAVKDLDPDSIEKDIKKAKKKVEKAKSVRYY